MTVDVSPLEMHTWETCFTEGQPMQFNLTMKLGANIILLLTITEPTVIRRGDAFSISCGFQKILTILLYNTTHLKQS